ncbi:hypothetical protein TNCV_3269041 [Trichonephila clavipes]|nr:hypothetical protein TNCV_3269041 [Trichonephila clavipes]
MERRTHVKRHRMSDKSAKRVTFRIPLRKGNKKKSTGDRSGVLNYDQKSYGGSESGIAWNSLRSGVSKIARLLNRLSDKTRLPNFFMLSSVFGLEGRSEHESSSTSSRPFENA